MLFYFWKNQNEGNMKEHLLTTVENSRNYTLAVAEAMPEHLYHFRPSEAIWDFTELLNHIAYGIEWWNDNYIKKIQTEWNPPAAEKTRKQVIGYISQAYASLKDTISKESLNDDKIKGFYATTDHITHHRGQAVIYLRCQGITPPEYTY